MGVEDYGKFQNEISVDEAVNSTDLAQKTGGSKKGGIISDTATLTDGASIRELLFLGFEAFTLN